MAVLNGLVPARFLTLVAHLVLVIIIFWSRTDNVEACLPLNYTQEEYDAKDTQLIIGLSISLAFFLLELIGFIGGISMFMPSQGLISTTAHTAAAVTLTFFLFDEWCANRFWYVFGFCSAFPAIVEIVVLIGVCGMKKSI